MFKDIHNEMDKKLEERKINPNGTNFVGIVMSAPGTEQVMLTTKTIEFMTCMPVGDSKKPRYCIVHKNRPLRYNGEQTNSAGHPVSIVTRIVYETMLDIINGAVRNIQTRDQEIARLTTKLEACEMTLNSLRKNGVID